MVHLVVLLVNIVSLVYLGVSIKLLWGWFLVSSLGLPDISIATGLGISILASLLTMTLGVKSSKDDDDSSLLWSVKLLVEKIFKITMLLLTGYIVHLFM